MKKNIKVMTVVGTRPEIIRLSRVIYKLNQYTEHTLVHTGQNYDYELNEIFFQDMKIKRPDYFLEAAGKNAAKSIAEIIGKVDDILELVKPHALLILGDTNSCLSVIPAKRRHIPVFHMEAGNRCFDQRVPEELNRKIVDHISDINLTYSDISREHLLNEGIASDRIIKTGSPMFEVLEFYKNEIKRSKVLQKYNLEKYNYFVMSVHREENIEPSDSFEMLLKMISDLSKSFNKKIIISTHPRTRKRLDAVNKSFNPNVIFLKPLGFFDYVMLQKSAFVTLSDSGTISEESSILNFPALNLREAHERPEAMEEGSVMMTGFNIGKIKDAINILSDQERGRKRMLFSVSDYSKSNVSDKVLRIILSYIDFINKKVWYN